MRGNEIYFERGSDGGFYGAPGSAFTFEWDGNSYQLINRDGTVYTFNADEKITRIDYIDGNYLVFTHDGERLSSVSNDSGTFSFGYNGDGNLASVTDNVGRTTSFTYSGDYLVSVTNTDGDTLQYTYDDGGRLTTVQDFNGAVYIQNTYDEMSRVVQQYVQGEDTFTFTYDKENVFKTYC